LFNCIREPPESRAPKWLYEGMWVNGFNIPVMPVCLAGSLSFCLFLPTASSGS